MYRMQRNMRKYMKLLKLSCSEIRQMIRYLIMFVKYLIIFSDERVDVESSSS